ncbi:MAG TPA: hypothetical protein VFM69_15850 [Pricia sp.]|nr:hypothetical protein [Pricia sp.]
MIPKSIEKRALTIKSENPSLDILDCVKQALIDEINFCGEMIDGKTERALHARKVMKQNTYAILTLKNSLRTTN